MTPGERPTHQLGGRSQRGQCKEELGKRAVPNLFGITDRFCGRRRWGHGEQTASGAQVSFASSGAVDLWGGVGVGGQEAELKQALLATGFLRLDGPVLGVGDP